MAIFVWSLAGAMALLGGSGYIYGISMLPTDVGAVAIISAVVVASAAVITAAIGAVVNRLDKILEALEVPPQSTLIQAPESPLNIENAVTPEPEIIPLPSTAPQNEVPIKTVLPEPTPKNIPDPRKKRFSFQIPETIKHKVNPVSGGVSAAALVAPPQAITEPENNHQSIENKPVSISLTENIPVGREFGQSLDAPISGLSPDVVPVETAIKKRSPVMLNLPIVESEYFEEDFSDEGDLKKESENPEVSQTSEPELDLEEELDKLIPLGEKREKAKTARPVLPIVEPWPKNNKNASETVEKNDYLELEKQVILPKREPELELPVSILSDPDASPAVTAPQVPTPGADIVGAYESGGGRYTMYSDGTVMAEHSGEVRYFASLEKLREFIESNNIRKG